MFIRIPHQEQLGWSLIPLRQKKSLRSGRLIPHRPARGRMGHNDRMPPDLTAGDLRRRRLHLPWIKLAFTVVLVLLGGTEVVISMFELGARSATTSAGTWADELSPSLVVLPLAVWFSPRQVLAWAAVVTWLISSGSVEFPFAWQTLSVLSLLSLLWVLIRPTMTHDAGPRVQPGGHRPAEGSYAVESPRQARVALAVAAVLAVTLCGWAWMTWDGSLERPSVTFMIAGILVPLIVWPSLNDLMRIHRRLALLRRGATERSVRVLRNTQDHHVLPVEALSPALHFARLDEVVDARVTSSFDEWLLEQQRQTLEQEDATPPTSDDALGEWADDQLVDWDDEEDEDEDEAHPEFEQWDAVAERNGPDATTPQTLSMIGKPFDGATVALVRSDGRTWVGELQEDLLWEPPARTRPPGGTEQPSATASQEQDEPRREDSVGAISGWVNRHVAQRWAWPLGLAVLGGVALPLVLSLLSVEDPYARYVGLLVALGYLFLSCADVTTVLTLQPTRRGVWSRRLLLDRRLGPERVDSIVAGSRAVALRERNRTNVIIFCPDEMDHPLTSEEYAEALRGALASTPPRPRLDLRPSSAVTSALLMILGWLILLPPTFIG